MRNAPPVNYPVERSCIYAKALCFFAVLGCVSQALWWWQSASSGWFYAFGFFIWLCAIFFAGYGWHTMPVGQMVWDGTIWRFITQNGQIEGTLTVYIDLQSSLLIHMRSKSRLNWIILEQGSAPDCWSGLRCALYAPPRGTH